MTKSKSSRKATPADAAPRPKAPGVPPEHLTASQRKHLRGLGHPLEPLIRVGKDGITDTLVEGVRQALIDHELVKVKLLQSCELDKDEAATALSDRVGAALVQRIGKTILLYAPHPIDPTIVLPGP